MKHALLRMLHISLIQSKANCCWALIDQSLSQQATCMRRRPRQTTTFSCLLSDLDMMQVMRMLLRSSRRCSNGRPSAWSLKGALLKLLTGSWNKPAPYTLYMTSDVAAAACHRMSWSRA